ncbi:MAG TPA: hypothetical protein VEJ44_06135, partial [Acidimicrobiales bacterium]|nr:hypothetical protein [Acidimicrobiales bacterium]
MTRSRPATPNSRRQWRVPALASLLVLAVAVAVPATLIGTTGAGHAAGDQLPGSVAAPSASEVSPICDAPDPTEVLGPQPSLPANPVS